MRGFAIVWLNVPTLTIPLQLAVVVELLSAQWLGQPIVTQSPGIDPGKQSPPSIQTLRSLVFLIGYNARGF